MFNNSTRKEQSVFSIRLMQLIIRFLIYLNCYCHNLSLAWFYGFCQRHYLVEGEAVVQMVGINDFPGLYVLRGRQGVTGTFIPSYK